jgi:mannosyltransferase OCH1-like enzyme
MTLWTNDRLLLARTEEWAKGLGMQMRELNELPIFDEYRDVFDRMLADNVVMASDLGRFLILHDLGGLYLDFDQVLYEWDERLNSFEFLSYTTD